MTRVARDRIADLFGLADMEARMGALNLSDRYIMLARRVGTRYNVRLMAEYRERYCRGCSSFWVEGRTVRTRLRRGRAVQTCLRCGRRRRQLIRVTRSGRVDAEGYPAPSLRLDEGATVEGELSDDEEFHGNQGEGP